MCQSQGKDRTRRQRICRLRDVRFPVFPARLLVRGVETRPASISQFSRCRDPTNVTAPERASANAYTYFSHKPQATYRLQVNPMTLARSQIATARLALAAYHLRYTMNHRHVQTPSRVRWAHSPLLARKSG